MNQAEYEQAMARIEVLIAADPAKDSPEGAELCRLVETVERFEQKTWPLFTYSPKGREHMLARMRLASNSFYNLARAIGCHPFIEFAGLMNEYIQICERAHGLGIDFTESSAHSGKSLYICTHEAAYVGEKLGCIYGPSLQSPENLRAFMKAAGLSYESTVRAIVEGIDAKELGRE